MRSRIRIGVRLSLLSGLCLALAACATGGGPDDADREYGEAMEREHEGDEPVPSPAAAQEPAQAVVGEDVYYAQLGARDVKGYLARPANGEELLPAVIVIHEWWGLNDNIRSMARQLAAEGYTALAVDLYEGETAQDRAGASALMQKAMARPTRLEDNLRQAHAFLRTDYMATRVGTIGWCFGGGWSLGTALLLGDEIDATVMYYGRVVTDEAALVPLHAPILGLFGSEDRGIPVSSVRAFEAALQRLGKPAEIYVYPGADHAFANPSGTRYDAPAAEDAWKKTLFFFDQHLR